MRQKRYFYKQNMTYGIVHPLPLLVLLVASDKDVKPDLSGEAAGQDDWEGRKKGQQMPKYRHSSQNFKSRPLHCCYIAFTSRTGALKRGRSRKSKRCLRDYSVRRFNRLFPLSGDQTEHLTRRGAVIYSTSSQVLQYIQMMWSLLYKFN